MHSLHFEKSVQISATAAGLVPPLVTTDKARQSSHPAQPTAPRCTAPFHPALQSLFTSMNEPRGLDC